MDWLLVYLGTVAIALCTIVVTRRSHETSIQRLSYLLAYILISESVGYYFRTHGLNNKFLFYFYQPIEYLFLCYLYAAHFTKPAVRFGTLVTGWLFILFSTGYIFWAWSDSQLRKDPVALSIVEWIMLFPLMLYYFYELYISDKIISITRQPIFWINSGNFLFYSGTFFLMGLLEEVRIFDSILANRLFLINTFLNIILYTFWTIGFLCPQKNIRYSY